MKYFDQNTWWWIALGAIFFLPWAGSWPLLPGLETELAQLARDMRESGAWLHLPPSDAPYLSDFPPFYFWLQQLTAWMGAGTVWSVRLPNAVLGIVILPFLYISGKFLVDRHFGFFWALCWLGSSLPMLYLKGGFIDPFFDFFTFSGIFFLVHYIWKKTSYRDLYFSKSTNTYLWLAGVFIGLAMLTQGPVAYLITLLSLALAFMAGRFRPLLPVMSFVRFSLLSVAVFCLWLIAWVWVEDPDYWREILLGQTRVLRLFAVDSDNWSQHLALLGLGFFPGLALALRGLGSFGNLSFHLRDFQRWMTILLLVSLVVFSISPVEQLHFFSLAYYPLSFLAAFSLWQMQQNRVRLPLWVHRLIVLHCALILALALIAAGLLNGATWLQGSLPGAIVEGLHQHISAGNAPHWFFVPPAVLALVLLFFGIQLRHNRARAFRILLYGNFIFTAALLIFYLPHLQF